MSVKIMGVPALRSGGYNGFSSLKAIQHECKRDNSSCQAVGGTVGSSGSGRAQGSIQGQCNKLTQDNLKLSWSEPLEEPRDTYRNGSAPCK